MASNLFFYTTNIGKIGIVESDGFISKLFFDNEKIPQGISVFESALLREAARELDLYLQRKLFSFNLPLKPAGTDFMVSVWNALREIPYGECSTYKKIAVSIGNPTAVRAVGMANNRNPIPIIIPCHRVIGSDGSLVGYRGGLELKKRLLQLESSS
ncbi:MAG: methylated-DNA--[protein]-cysteine S-methyltransferase [Fibrobacter sp.]|nr:methylated-DNA--[protein]-cysteine S-methyltransferase [Fibrobacter sp.]